MDNGMESIRTLNEAMRLVDSGVFGVFDHPRKLVFISCSNNVIKGIASLVTKITDQDHVASQMLSYDVQVLYLGPNPRFEGSKIIQKWEKEGYRVLNSVAPIKLSAKVRVLYMGDEPVVVVTLRSARGNERIVGSFKSMADCEPWFEEHYPNGYVDQVVELGDEFTEKVKEFFR